MAMLSFQNSSDTSSNGKWSLQETGHALHLSGPCSSQEDSSALSDFPSTPNHTYEALPSLPPRQPIFEDLTGSFDCLPVMKSNVNVGLYSVIGPIESEGESSSPVLSGVAQYSEPQCEGMGTRQALPHAPSTPTHEVVEPNFQFNPQCSSSPWSPPSVDLNWCKECFYFAKHFYSLFVLRSSIAIATVSQWTCFTKQPVQLKSFYFFIRNQIACDGL